MRDVIIIGATSAVAIEIAKIHAAESDNIILVGRNARAISDIAEDLKIRGASAEVIVQDLALTDNIEDLIDKIFDLAPRPWGIYIAHGTLPDQQKCEASYSEAQKAIVENSLSQIALLTGIANRLVELRSGKIGVITSVAGDRGRQSNYVYGAAKGMLSIFLQGLRNRLASSEVHVLTVKPGFIDTPMTAAIENKGFLWATPQKVATDICRGMKKNRNVIYTPSFWWVIMFIIGATPEFIFKKLTL